jgi:hypothetical protein
MTILKHRRTDAGDKSRAILSKALRDILALPHPQGRYADTVMEIARKALIAAGEETQADQ